MIYLFCAVQQSLICAMPNDGLGGASVTRHIDFDYNSVEIKSIFYSFSKITNQQRNKPAKQTTKASKILSK